MITDEQLDNLLAGTPDGIFDPEGSGYDYESAEKYGLVPDETGHYPSRVPETGLLLKGRGHETWHKTVKGEEEAGYEIYQGDDGRYYSRKKSLSLSPWQPKWNPSFTDGDKFDQMAWPTERIDKTKSRLHSVLMGGDTQPPPEDIINKRLQDWWKVEGQHLPRFVLDEIGVVGGAKVPTFPERMQAIVKYGQEVNKERVGAVKEFLDIDQLPDEYDYLHAAVIADPDDFAAGEPEKIDVPLRQKLKSVDDESLKIISDVAVNNIMEFPAEVLEGVNREIAVREYKEKMTDLMVENPEAATLVLIGTQFFNTLAGNAPEFLSRKGINLFENIPADAQRTKMPMFDVLNAVTGKADRGETAAVVEAARRIRTELVASDPTLLNKISMNTGALGAEIIKFAALPDVGKIKYFKHLPSAVKGAIGIGTKSALIATLKLPEEGETIGERALEVGISTATGATVGALFGFGKDVVGKFAQKIKLESTRKLLTGKASPEFKEYIKGLNPEQLANLQAAVNDSAVLKAGKITTEEFLKRHEPFLNALAKDAAEVVKPVVKSGLSRAGMAEIGGEVSKKALEWAVKQGIPQGATAEVISQAVTEAVREGADVPPDVLKWHKLPPEKITLKTGPQTPTGKPRVKPVPPVKIVSPEEAGPMRVTFKKTADLPETRIIADPKVRRAVQTKENEIAKLKTRLKQAKVDKYTSVEKAIQQEIDKKQASLDTLKKRQSIKLANTTEEIKSKILKIRSIGEFKQDVIKEAISSVRAIPRDIRPDFFTRAGNVKTIKGLYKLADEIEDGIAKFEKKEAIGKIKSVVADIEKKGRRGTTRLGKIPSPQREQLIELIDSVDLKKLTDPKEQDLLSLQKYTQKIATQLAGNLEALDTDVEAAMKLPSARVQELLRLSKMNVNDMEAADIELVTQSLENLAHQAKIKSSLIQRQGYKPLDGALKEIEVEIAPTRTAKKKAGKPIQTERGKIEKTVDFANRVARLSDAHLDTLVELSTIPGAKKLRQILDYDLHDGMLKSYEKMVEWSEKTASEFERIGFTDFSILDDKVKITFVGKKVNVTKDYLIKLELKSRDYRNLKAMLTTEGWSIGGKKIEHTEDINRLKELNDALQIVRNDPMLMGIADWTNKLNLLRQDALNETSMKLEGFQLARDKTYTSNPRALPKRVEGGKSEISVPPEQRGRYLPVTGGTQMLRLDKWSDDFLLGIESDSFYHGMAIPLRNARAIVNSKSFQQMMYDAGRQAELDHMITILKRTQGIYTTSDMLDMFGGWIMRGFTGAALGARVSTVGTQAMSYPAAFSEIPWKYARTLRKMGKSTISRIEEDSAIMKMRWKGRKIGVEVGQAAGVEAFDILFLGQTKGLINRSMSGLVFGDKQAIGNIYEAVERELLGEPRSGKNVSVYEWNGNDVEDLPSFTDRDSKEFRYAAARRLEYVTRRTQPMYDMLDRSSTLSDKNIWRRQLFIFRTALEAQENIGIRAFDAYGKSAKDAAAKKELSRKLGSVVVSAFSVAVWKNAWKWATLTGATTLLSAIGIYKFKEPKEKADVAKDLGTDTLKNLASLSRFGKLAVTAGEKIANRTVGDGYNWNRETFQLPMIDTLESGSDAIVSISRAIYNAGLIDEFVEEENKLDAEFNDQLADRLANDLANTIKSTFNFGVRITGLPLLAPTQEFINPFLKKSDIKLIREITYEDTESPQKFAERVYEYYEKRRELKKESKKTRLTENEDAALIVLDKLTSYFNQRAEQMKQEPDIKERRYIIEQVESAMDTTDYYLENLN